MYWKEREGKILFLILNCHLKPILILKMRNFAAFEFNIINSHQFLLIHIFFPKYARCNEWPCKRIKLCKDTCVKSSCKYRRALFDCHRPQRCFRIGCVKRKKKKKRRISELFVGGCYCEQTISNEKSAKPSPHSIRRTDRSLFLSNGKRRIFGEYRSTMMIHC